MARLLAIAELRLREGIAARLAWLVPIAFLVGVGAAAWAPGPDAAARAALADRVVAWSVGGVALIVAVVVPAIGFPSDVRTGAAHTLLSAPVSRFAVVLGGTLGYGALSTLLCLAMGGAALLGLDAGGLGARARAAVRAVSLAEPVDAAPDGSLAVTRQSNVARFRFRVPAGVPASEPLRVRLAPHPRYESSWERGGVAMLSIHAPDGDETSGRQVVYKAGNPFVAELPFRGLAPGDEAELTVRRASGGFALVFPAGSVEIGGAREMYAWSALKAVLCAVPLLFVLAAVGSLGAVRFGAPTALAVALFLMLVFAGQGLIEEGARYLETAAAEHVDAASSEHSGHSHGPPPDASPSRVFAARVAKAALRAVPAASAFDVTDDLFERRAVPMSAIRGALVSSAAPFAALTALAWLLLRRRELLPS